MSKQSWRGSTLLNPEPPVLVSCGGLEQPNLITIGWTGTICTQPSMVSISVRPERYSHHLIKESGQFAINLPTEQLVRAVDWCGVKSGRDNDKFAACKLHAAPGSVLTDCPILEESPVNLECRVTQVIPLGSHDLFLAEVMACDVDESLLDENGKLCLDKAKLIVYSHGEYLSVRPERYSHHLIKESGQFAINLPTEQLVRAVDWCGVKSGRDNDKFAACKLHAAPGSVLTDCPILEESPVNLECRVTQVIPLGSHDLFLAEVMACDVDESLLDENGKLCLDKAKLIVYSHGEYLSLGKKLGTFGYSVRKKRPGKRKK